MSRYDTQRPYAASYVIVQNDSGHIAMVLRTGTDWMNNHYGLPSGKTEKRETFSQGAVREALEEIGITITLNELEHAITVHRFSSKDKDDSEDMEWIDLYFTVRNYNGKVINAEPHMHSEVAWLDPNNLPSNVIPSVAASLKAWADGQKYLEHGWK